MLINPIFRESFFQEFRIHSHLRQSINERNVHIQILQHIKKLLKLSIKFSLGKFSWEWQRQHVRFWERGLRLFTLLTLTLLLRHILTRPSTSILIMTSLLVLLNSNPLETSNCLPLVNSMQLQCSLGLGSCLLGNVPRGVEEKLASYAI